MDAFGSVVAVVVAVAPVSVGSIAEGKASDDNDPPEQRPRSTSYERRTTTEVMSNITITPVMSKHTITTVMSDTLLR
ncbi:hypothetical protein EKO27_g9706 [Xylaria grammica]|uniref:Secreted protein n=1 Tax=Xylaria grammica TaxID=363999 RepID=A0A439CTI6_9PEZI|nr:hypothetical protein EKO27_g9706 [Xylaria grammica]